MIYDIEYIRMTDELHMNTYLYEMWLADQSN